MTHNQPPTPEKRVETPRTAEVWAKCQLTSWENTGSVMKDHAEQLEQELQQAKEASDQLRTSNGQLLTYLERAGWGPCNTAACNCNGWHKVRESRDERELGEQLQQAREELDRERGTRMVNFTLAKTGRVVQIPVYDRDGHEILAIAAHHKINFEKVIDQRTEAESQLSRWQECAREMAKVIQNNSTRWEERDCLCDPKHFGSQCHKHHCLTINQKALSLYSKLSTPPNHRI